MKTVPPTGLRLERRRLTHPDAVRLVEEVQAEYVVRYGGPDESPIEENEFEGSAGIFYVGYQGVEPVATGAWRRIAVPPAGQAGPCAEIKRMYVRADQRGRGLGRQMLRLLEQEARAAGMASLVLETGIRQPEAIDLYESSGYHSIAGYGHYRDSDLSRCYAKALPGGAARPVDTPF